MRLTPLTRLLRLMIIIVPSILLIAGCGDGSGKAPVAGTQSPALTGVLLDAPLAGVAWTNAGGDLSGITDGLGEFQYRRYESVTFSIGGIVLGTAAGAPFVTAVQLTGSSNPTDQAALNQLVFLQSIDIDRDPSNGIFISEATRNRAAGVALDFRAPDFAARVAVVVAAIGEPGSTVVSEMDALQHFFETFSSMGGEAVLGFPFPGFAPSEFTLVFSDEFDVGDSPSTSKWLIETGYGDNGWGNNEWQLYTDSPDNVRVEDGNLVLQARCPTPPCGVRDGTVTSARINTLGKFEFKYGKIIARIKAPVGKAAWPAFWALGANFPQVGWPRTGEIDFMEMHNFFSDERTTHSTLHWCDQTIQAPATCSFPDGWIFDTQNRTFPTSLGDDFHIWEADWDENKITVKIDDTPYFSRTIDAATMEEFQREFFLILNVAMGGTLGSNSQPPDGTEVFPQTMLVDYVRVFQREGTGTVPDITIFDFEQAPENYVFTEFEGGPAVVIANPVPVDGLNTSAQVARMQKFPAGSGATFGGSLLALPEPLDIAAGTSFTMKVWSQRSVRVLFKLEGPDGVPQTEAEVAHGGSGWEELTFNFGSFAATVTNFVFIFDNGVLGGADTDEPNWTFYFDDITLVAPSDDDGPGGGPDSSNIDFEEAAGSYLFTEFEGGPAVVIDNPVPVAGINTSAQVVRMQKFPAGSGATFGGSLLALPAPVDIAAGTSYTMQVWSQRPVRVLFKLEGPGGMPAEEDEVMHGGSGWEVLTFDFGSFAATVTSYVFIFDNGVLGGADTDELNWTFYFDDITRVPPDDGGGPGGGLAQISLPITFDNPAVDYTVIDFGEPVSAETFLVADPADSTNTVASTRKATGTPVWAGTTMSTAAGFAAAIPFTAGATTIGIRVYSPDAGIPVRLKAENATDDSVSVETEAMTTVANAWETLIFDFANEVEGAPLNLSATYAKLSIFFNFGTDGDTAGDKTYLWDDVEFGVQAPVVDVTPPSLTVARIASNNTNAAFARVGSIITVTITADEPITAPTVTIGGTAATSVTGSGTAWQARRTLTAADAEGPLTFSIAYSDIAGNAGAGVTTTTNASAVVVDKTVPTVMILGAPATFATLTPISITFQFSEVVSNFSVSGIQATNGVASGLVSVDGDTYTANITPTGTGAVAINVIAGAARDAAGNVNPFTGSVIVVRDTTPPTLSSVNIASNNANPAFAVTGNTVTVSLTASETILSPVVTIGGMPADTVTGAGTTWQARRMLTTSDTTEGAITFAIAYVDLLGNLGAPVSTSSDTSGVVLDVTAPTVAITAPASLMTRDPFSVTFQFSETVTGFTVADIAVTNGTASGLTAMDGDTSYTATITPGVTGDLTIGLAAGAAQDRAGNPSQMAATVTIIGDSMPPSLSSISIASNNANPVLARAGDLVTATFTADEPIMAPTVTIGGIAATSVINSGGNTWQASRTITAGETGGTLALSITYSDLSGNAGTVETMTDDGSSVLLDVMAPTVTITAPAAVASLAAISVTFEFSETVTGFNAVSDIVAINATASAPVLMAGNTYTANITPDGEGNVSIGVAMGAAQDLAGNPNTMATTVTVMVDTTPPELAPVSIASNNANPVLARIGDVITVTMMASEPISAPVVTIAGTLATSVTNVSGDQVNWQASRMLSAGSDGPVAFNITYADITGTAGMPVNMTSDGSSVFLDVTLPMVINLGAPANFINLDPIAVTVQFDSVVTGFDNTMTDIVVTNGNAVAITPSDGLNYTVSVRPFGTGNLTAAVAAGAAQDAAGNPNPESSMVTIVENLPAGAPRLTAINVVSNNPNNSGYARNGETVTITMTADEPIAAPVVTIGGIAATSVINSSGNTWQASRNVLATDTGVVQDMPVAFTINIEDTSGTPGIGQFEDSIDGSSVIFDNVGPTLTISGVPMNFDTLTPLLVTFEFVENVSGFTVDDIIVMGGSRSGFTMDDASTYTATVTPDATIDLTVSVAAGAAIDAAGNPSTADSKTALRNDTTKPTLGTVSIASSPGNPAFARTGDVVMLDFTASEPLMTPTVTIDGATATITGGGTTWQASHTLAAGMDRIIGFEINYVDLFSNAAEMPGTATTDSSSVTFDMTAPTVVSITDPGDVSTLAAIPVTIEFSEAVTGFDAVSDIVTTNATASAPVLIADTFTYTTSITPAGDGEVSIGVPMAAAQDLAGNDNTMATAVTFVVDTTPPELTAVAIASDNTTNSAYATEGNEVTLDFTASEAIAAPTVTIGEMAATTVTNTSGDQINWAASRAVLAADAGIVQDMPVTFSIGYQDVLGNAGVTVTATTAPATSVIFDSSEPMLTISGIPATLTSLDDITVTFTFDEEVIGFDDGDLVIGNGTLLAFNPVGAAMEYTADIEPDGAGDFTVSVASGIAVATDAAGNGIVGNSASAELVPFWLLAWSDEFDGTGLPANWTARTGTMECPDPCTGEQTYQTANVSVADGVLTIVAMDDGGSVFSSGLVDTLTKQEFQYGRVEIRAKLPGTIGSEPSLWLAPAPAAPADEGVFGPWPLSGEIDIVNTSNLDVSMIREHTLWYGLPEPEQTETTGTTPFTSDGEFHVYEIEWEAGEIRWFVDGVHVVTQTDDNWYAYYPQVGGVYNETDKGVYTAGTGAAPFDQPFYLVMNLAVNNGAGGGYTDQLQIDYVRVYECFAGDPVNGTGCSSADPENPLPPVMAPGAPYTDMLEAYTDGPTTMLDFIDESTVTTSRALVAEKSDNPGAGVVVTDDPMATDGVNTVWNVNAMAPVGMGAGSVFIQPGDFLPDAVGFFDLTGGGTTGEVLFRMRVFSTSDPAPMLSVGIDSETGSGRQFLELPEDSGWTQYSVKIADLMPLDLSDITRLFVLDVTNGTAIFELDDIKVKVACLESANCEATARTFVPPVYSQSFEMPGIPDTANGRIGDDWRFFIGVLRGGAFQFGYSTGTFAPNGTGHISAIVTGEGGTTQGDQQLSVFSDYTCCPGGFGHQAMNPMDRVETNVFQQRNITADDVGKVLTFNFDVKRGDIAGLTRAYAFIRVFAPGFGSVVGESVIETTARPVEWGRSVDEVQVTIESGWVGNPMQFGFQSDAGEFESSNMFYDNVELLRSDPAP